MTLQGVIREIQAALLQKGLYAGKVDGNADTKTWSAIYNAIVTNRPAIADDGSMIET